MRYLKTYESHKYIEINQNLKDICLELTDNGFFYYLNHNLEYPKSPIEIEIRKGKVFKWSEIADVVERLKDYLIPIGYDWKYDARKNDGGHVLFRTDDIWTYTIKFEKK